ncbi:DUF6550 family protein [Intestinimonas butyriciproducens]|uniref:DUF6550 family protein n=1 Tax=Intestinimonas butyriciproducens TaxID=1297617 RepID=UPI00189D23A4|nr:DUF6550 family protein [Intestinimonas butyriciproducens]
MKKRIIIAATFTACLALCAAVWPQAETVGKTHAPPQTPAVSTSRTILSELEVTTEKETVKASEPEPATEVTAEELPAPAPETEKQPEAEQEPMLPTKAGPDPAPAQPTQLKPESEASNSASEDMVYVPGFGWIESQGPNHVEYAEDMYENGNKIGIMG